jgi:hypothetical protein
MIMDIAVMVGNTLIVVIRLAEDVSKVATAAWIERI